MIEGLFRRTPEDETIPVLTEVIVPAPAPSADPPHPEVHKPAVREYRADPLSIDFAAELVPLPSADAAASAQALHDAPASPHTTPAANPQTLETIPAAPSSTLTDPDLAVPALSAPTPGPYPSGPVLAGGGMHEALSEESACTNAPAPVPDPEEVAARVKNEVLSEVLSRLNARFDPMLDHRLAESMREVLDAELPALRAKLADALANTVQDVVSRAIANEFAKLQAMVGRTDD